MAFPVLVYRRLVVLTSRHDLQYLKPHLRMRHPSSNSCGAVKQCLRRDCIVGPKLRSIVLHYMDIFRGIRCITTLLESCEIQLHSYIRSDQLTPRFLVPTQLHHCGRSWASPLLASAGPSTLTGYSGLGAKYAEVCSC
jgi:hypothetical protein